MCYKNMLLSILSLFFTCGFTMFGATNTTPNSSKSPAALLAHKQAVTSKTGYYSMERVLHGSKELQEALKPLHKEIQRAEEELKRQGAKIKAGAADFKKMQDQLIAKKAELEKKRKISSEDAVLSMESDLSDLQAEIAAKNEQLMTLDQTLRQRIQYLDMQAMQEEQRIRKPIMDKIFAITSDLLKLSGWDVLIPIEVPMSERVDVSAEITHELNKGFKPAVTAPAAAKPKVQAV